MNVRATAGSIVARCWSLGLILLFAVACASLLEAGAPLAVAVASVSIILTATMIVADVRGRRSTQQRLEGAQALYAAIVDLLTADGLNAAADDGTEKLATQIARTLERLSRQLDADRAWLIVGGDGDDAYSWSAAGDFGLVEARRLTSSATAGARWEGDHILLRGRDGGDGLASRLYRGEAAARASLVLLRSAEPEDVALLGFASASGLRIWRETPDGLGAALGVILQVLRRRQVTENRLALERKLAIGRRMETIGALASGIAHNLNNIIGAIAGFGETAAMHVAPGSAAANSLAEIPIAVDRARTLVGDVLRFGRRVEGPPERVEIAALLAETRRLLTASLAADIALEIEHVPDTLIIAGEAGQLQQVLLNIFNNAALAMPSGGTIRCECERCLLEDPVALSHSVIPRGTYVRIAIADEGGGIAPTALAHLFDPFFTTRVGGTGLGLSTARDIVEEHGGAIDVTSVVGHGSRFALWLPLMEAVPDADRDYRRGSGETVLLLNRDPNRLAKDEELVAALGYEPRGAVAGDPAVPDDEIDVVLVTGFDVGATEDDVARLRARGWQGPVIVAVPEPVLVPGSPALRYPLRPADLAGALSRLFEREEHRLAPASSAPPTAHVTRNISASH